MSSSVIARGLDQIHALIAGVADDQWDRPTPCSQWSVGQLVDHVVAIPEQFTAMVTGEQVDWSAPTPHHDDRAGAFRQHADDLIAALDASDGAVPEGMLAAEFAVHAWDLSNGLGRDTGELDPEVARTGFDFISKALTAEQRGGAFDPEKPAPDDANAYEQIAAFAGRDVPFRPER